jgi:hypothetical protein
MIRPVALFFADRVQTDQTRSLGHAGSVRCAPASPTLGNNPDDTSRSSTATRFLPGRRDRMRSADIERLERFRHSHLRPCPWGIIRSLTPSSGPRLIMCGVTGRIVARRLGGGERRFS